MKRMISAVFVIVAALLGCFLLVRRLFVRDASVQRARVVTPVVDADDDGAERQADAYLDSYTEMSFITLAQDETLLSTVTMDIDGDGYDDQINVVKTAGSQFITLVVALYNPRLSVYERAANLATVVTQARTFACTGMDVIGNHHSALVYQGTATNGHSVLRMYLGSRDKRGNFEIALIGDFDTDGTVFVQQLDRDETYDLALAKGVSFPVWVHSSEIVGGTNRIEQIQTEYRWNESEQKYTQAQRIRVANTSVATAELAKIKDEASFAQFLDGLWYKVENTSRGIRSIFFDATTREIIFEYDDSEEVYKWMSGNVRRGGMSFTATNASIENLSRRCDISLVKSDEIRVRLQDDVRMTISESNLWDGNYKKMTTKTFAAPADKTDALLKEIAAARWKAADGTEIAFTDGTYTATSGSVQDAGRFMRLTVSGQPVLQFRSETQRPFFKATYLFGYQKVSATETAGRRAQPKLTDDKNTLVLRHVVVRPDGYYQSEDKPLVLTRIDE